MQDRISKYYLFTNAHKFPWSEIGLDRPSYGQVHSYLCSILAPYVDSPWSHFMKGKPAFFELKWAAENSGEEEIRGIYKYCETLYQNHKWDREDTDKEVLGYLRNQKDFNKMLDDTLWRLHMRGAIQIPKEMFYDKTP